MPKASTEKDVHKPSVSKDEDTSLKTFKNFDIREVTDRDPIHTPSEQLGRALTDEKAVIVIKDPALGSRTALWMGAGKCMHHMALATALGSIICSSGAHERLLDFAKPLALGSVVLNAAYYSVWHRTPLMDYRVAQTACVVKAIRKENDQSTILVRKVMRCTSYPQIAISATAMVIAFWRDVWDFNFKDNFNKIIGKTADETNETINDSNSTIFEKGSGSQTVNCAPLVGCRNCTRGSLNK